MNALQHDDLARVLLQVVVILGAARALGLVARRLGQPAVVAEIVAGILLGPSLLGWAAPSAFAWLFPPSSLAGLTLLSQLGLVLFMFLVGLELDPELLRGRAHTPVLVGIASIALPLVLGVASAPWLHARYGEGVPLPSFALFLGAALGVTAFPVLARILSERHLLTTRVGAIAIACAAVDDLAAWCLLSVVIAVARADAWPAALRVIALAFVFVLGVIALLRPMLLRVVRRTERHGVDAAAITGVLFVLLLVSATSELIGLHALFGAFLLGAVLPKHGPLAEALADRIETLTLALLLPLFFAYSGLRTQLTLVDEPAEWIAIGAVIVIASAGKLGAALVGRLTGLAWREAIGVGVLLNARGLMGLIVLNVGLDLGIVSPALFAILVVMAIATTLITAPLLRVVYPDREIIESRFAPEPATTPSPSRRDARDVLLACVSDPRSGPGLATIAHALAADRARVLGLHLGEPSDRVTTELRHESEPEPTALASFLERARALSVDVRGLSFVSATPADDIVRIGDAKRASIVLLGAHAPMWIGGRLDGVVRDVLRTTKRTVAVLVGADRAIPRDGIARALVAYAGPDDAPALAIARRLAERAGTHVVVLAIVAPGAPEPEALASVRYSARDVVRASAPHDALVDAARRHAPDLVVIAHADRWRLSADRLGGSRASIFERVEVPLLVVHDADVAAAPVARDAEVGA